MPSLRAITDNGSGRVGSEPRARARLYCCHIQSCGSRPDCLNQSSICAVESTWSSCLPLGNTVSSCKYSASQPASLGQMDKAVFDHRGLRVHAHDFVGLRLIAGDRVQPFCHQLLDQLGSRGLVLDQHDTRFEGRALLAYRAL